MEIADRMIHAAAKPRNEGDRHTDISTKGREFYEFNEAS
jgi:hypothetical protein